MFPHATDLVFVSHVTQVVNDQYQLILLSSVKAKFHYAS